MVHNITNGTRLWVLALLVLALAVTGCSTQVAAESATGGPHYSGALATDYEDALDPVTQLALGTLSIEGSGEAVTAAQAAVLLPLWQVLQDGDLQGDAERYAVLAQVEAAMRGEQLSSIAARQLTQADLTTWSQQGGQADGAPAREGMPQVPDGASAPEGMPQMSDEDRAALREQFSALGGPGGGASGGVLGAVVELLSAQVDTSTGASSTDEPSAGAASPADEAQTTEPSSVDAASSEPPTAEPEVDGSTKTADAASGDGSETASTLPEQADPGAEVHYVVRAGNTLAAIAEAYGVTVAAIVEANDIADPNAIDAGQALTIPDPALVPETVPAAAESTATGASDTVPTGASTAAVAVAALEWLPDDDPGPPLTVEVSANTATQDPLVKASRTYLVTGVVRNDGDETHAVSGILATFYDAGGFRGTFEPALWGNVVVGGEWHWHGETEAEFAALLLAPGEAWPFRIAIVAQNMASFLIHPDAAPTARESAPVILSDVRLVDEGTGYLRISGTARNDNAFAVKNVTVSGVLLDANGQIVSLGSTYVLQEDIAPGASVAFDLRIEREAYASYQLYAQAERDG